MKLEINTTILNKELISLEENINKFIDSNNDIYNELSKINDYWQGIDAEYFINIINKDKSNCLLILDNLYKTKTTIVKSKIITINLKGL